MDQRSSNTKNVIFLQIDLQKQFNFNQSPSNTSFWYKFDLNLQSNCKVNMEIQGLKRVKTLEGEKKDKDILHQILRLFTVM